MKVRIVNKDSHLFISIDNKKIEENDIPVYFK